MIFELIEHLITPASSHAKKFGFVHQSIAIRKRYFRNKAAWQPHLDHCQQFLKRQLATVPRGGKVLVLGSGHLFETPIDLLLGHFDQVTLLDGYHPATVVELARKNNKVVLIEEDLNWDMISEIGSEQTRTKTDFGNYDFVISANVLSQLPIFPLQWAKKMKTLPEERLEALIFSMFRKHLTDLKKAKHGALLFTDVHREYLSKDEKLLRIELSLLGFEMPKPIEEWYWNLAPIPELSKTESMQLKIQAFRI